MPHSRAPRSASPQALETLPAVLVFPLLFSISVVVVFFLFLFFYLIHRPLSAKEIDPFSYKWRVFPSFCHLVLDFV